MNLLDIRKRDKAFIVELKKDEKVDIALAQIKEKEYVQKFKSENNEVLAVAICYDSKTKKHSCNVINYYKYGLKASQKARLIFSKALC